MPLISPIIEKAAGYVPDSLYLRATDTQMNIDVGEIEMEGKTVILYNNLPTIKHRVRAGVQREYPVEVKILKLAGVDDNDMDGDAIRAELLPVADLIFDACLKDPNASTVQVPQDYVIDCMGQVKIYDDVLTGVVLKFTMYLDRTFFCVPSEPIPTP